jgi:hypothetical protein
VTPSESENPGSELAQVNVGRLVAPLDDPRLAAFVANLDPVNAAAEGAPGFVWRLQTDEGNATSIEAFAWDAGDSAGIITNLSVWRDLESLQAFVSSDVHRAVLLRRRQWFQLMAEASLACWWVPVGHRPSTQEAEERIRHLREHGPTPCAFTLRQSFPMAEAQNSQR